MFGLRIDLDDVERRLADDVGVSASVVCVEERLFVFVSGRVARASLADATAAICGVPLHAVDVCVLASVPRTPSGKADTVSLEHHARLLAAARADESTRWADSCASVDCVDAVRDEYARLLGRPDGDA